MIVIRLLFFALLSVLSFWFFLYGVSCLFSNWGNSETPRDRRRHARPRVLPTTFVVTIIIPLLVFSASAVGLFTTAKEVQENKTASEPPLSESVEPSVKPEPDFPTSPPVTKEEDIFSAFRLSEVEDSTMLTLDKQLIGSAEIDAGQLAAAADERLGAYIAQYSRSHSFFPFYPDLADFFPPGEDICYSFDSVSSLEECNAQLRGAGERLARCRAKGSLEAMGGICRQLAIRSRDALKFTKYQTTLSEKNRLIWLYSEISFSALINEYVFARPEGLALSDWYYRTAQVFDYLGGIADTEELELRMYFLSDVFLRCSFEELKEQGLQTYPDAYDSEIWTLYMNMLYRVAERVTPAQAEGFYLEIRNVETIVLQQPLPDTVIARTTEAVNGLSRYQEWRRRYG